MAIYRKNFQKNGEMKMFPLSRWGNATWKRSEMTRLTI